MEWLYPFVTLALCCGLVLSLLPEGSLRRTAALVLGLMMTLCWAESLAVLFHWPALTDPPATVLVQSGYESSAGGD